MEGRGDKATQSDDRLKWRSKRKGGGEVVGNVGRMRGEYMQSDKNSM